MLDISTKYDEFIDYVAEGYSSIHNEEKAFVKESFVANGVDQFLIAGYHPLARHNRIFISRKIDEFLSRKKGV